MQKSLLLKRQIDFWIAFWSLIILLPFLALVSLAIKLDSRGPVFFRHERIGKGGKPFLIWKFRTMIEGAMDKGLGVTVAKNDSRITRKGKFLRNWGIDELPQFINVLKGEMSLVGPRATFGYQVEKYNDFQKKRLAMRPGMTGWAIIHGRNLLSWEKRIKYDVWYVENWSVGLDFKILFLTFKIVFSQKGLYGKGGINDPFL